VEGKAVLGQGRGARGELVNVGKPQKCFRAAVSSCRSRKLDSQIGFDMTWMKEMKYIAFGVYIRHLEGEVSISFL
jgi:hypothetical protein